MPSAHAFCSIKRGWSLHSIPVAEGNLQRREAGVSEGLGTWVGPWPSEGLPAGVRGLGLTGVRNLAWCLRVRMTQRRGESPELGVRRRRKPPPPGKSTSVQETEASQGPVQGIGLFSHGI